MFSWHYKTPQENSKILSKPKASFSSVGTNGSIKDHFKQLQQRISEEESFRATPTGDSWERSLGILWTGKTLVGKTPQVMSTFSRNYCAVCTGLFHTITRRHNTTCHFTLPIARTACTLQKHLMKTEELQQELQKAQKKRMYVLLGCLFSPVRNNSMIKINYSRNYQTLPSNQEPSVHRVFHLFINLQKNDWFGE